MSEKMVPLSIRELLDRMTTEYKRIERAFTVQEGFKISRYDEWRKKYADSLGEQAVANLSGEDKFLPIFGEKLEVPLGPAAGPHTQMAQNIISAYIGGARFFELKTVQVMDGEELAKCIARPCIKADDEGYNCEWSTELTVEQALEEYVKAWCVIKVIARAFGLGDPDGFVFNMSVGYDLAGIQSEKLDRFIEGLKDASALPIFIDTKNALKEYYPEYTELIDSISPRICRSVTLSTLHGCPPDEIERIATYLLTEKGLHTFVKCNPTILGYEDARAILDKAGFDYIAFDEHHFKEDLQWDDAVKMFRRLQELAESKGLEFGVKLSNTFPVDVKNGELPSDEMYMSGRALFHLTIEMAHRFSQEFNGKLRISYSGGVTQQNVKFLFLAGIWPITMATILLKPGGYSNMASMAYTLRICDYQPFTRTDTDKIAALQKWCMKHPSFRKPIKPMPQRKNGEQVPLFDCYTAPCQGGCPIHQDIPAYVHLVEKEKHQEALKVILQKNPLPFTTGLICSHPCMSKCTRNHYNNLPIDIRGIKYIAACEGYDEIYTKLQKPAPNGRKVAVIGAGAAGLSAAYFLARDGFEVDVFEQSNKAGGIITNVIPDFRISPYFVKWDIALIEKMGANIKLNTPAPSLDRLKADGYEAVVCGIGAYKERNPHITGNVMNVLDFLCTFKNGGFAASGLNDVVVIGGGNTAMDAARAATRIDGIENVSIIYRRTKKYMPADEEELKEALKDGVKFIELAAPIEQKGGKLLCSVMRLGEPDASGRRSPVATDETIEVEADLIVAAIGEEVDNSLFTSYGITADENGRIPFLTEIDGMKVYNIGDSLRSPSTVVECIADAQRAADDIIGTRLEVNIPMEAIPSVMEAIESKRVVDPVALTPISSRCLSCDTVCENCVSVCPNRANAVVEMPDGRREILHIDRLCNECGNCRSFCPYDSAPYLDKLTFFEDADSFASSTQKGFLILDDHTVRVRLDDITDVDLDQPNDLPKDVEVLILTVMKDVALYR
ncbi:MAG TPA: putative selenate reductase subunit YgfK [Ruminococcaceae bacterium]|nr:putative selenate reductase subunit YgfK [Oscillospiraceae bacterium]